MSTAHGTEICKKLAAKWRLSLGAPYSDDVIAVTREDGTPAVLKLTRSPDEAAALQAFAGGAAIELLAHDAARGAMLVARAEPGVPLSHLCETDDTRATSIAANIARELRRDAGSFPSAETWCAALTRVRNLPPAVRPLADAAAAVAAELFASPARRFLLHGDLHQDNILSAGRGWVAIDPKGVIGEAEFEIAPLVLNPVALLRRGDLSTLIARRIDQLRAELELDAHRADAWTFVRAVLAVVWAFEDDGSAPPEWMECAEILRRRVSG